VERLAHLFLPDRLQYSTLFQPASLFDSGRRLFLERGDVLAVGFVVCVSDKNGATDATAGEEKPNTYGLVNWKGALYAPGHWRSR
jgi:hypothetical protein